MYWSGTCTGLNDIAEAIKSFAGQVGFTTVADTTNAGLAATVTTSVKTTEPFLPDNACPLGAALVYSATLNEAFGSFNEGAAAARKIVFRDGTKSRYFHIFIYDSKVVGPSGDGYAGIIEGWMSTGFSADTLLGHGGLIKGSACTDINLSISNRVVMFGGKNDDGDCYLHFVVETQPQFYSIFGFGTMDKNFGFAGGEFIAGNSCPRPATGDRPTTQTKYASRDYQSLPYGSPGTIGAATDYAYIPGLTVRASLYTSVATTLPNDQWAGGAAGYGHGGTSVNSMIFAIGGNCKKLFTGHGGISGYPWWGLFKCANFPRNLFSGLNPMFPAWVGVRDVTTTVMPPYFAMIGSVPGVRFLDINSIVPENELQLGHEAWKVFPAKYKSQSFVERLLGYTQYEGLAFLK